MKGSSRPPLPHYLSRTSILYNTISDTSSTFYYIWEKQLKEWVRDYCKRYCVNVCEQIQMRRRCAPPLNSGPEHPRYLCEKSFQQAEDLVKGSRTGCSTCQFVRCDHECARQECRNLESHNWRRHVERCGGCVGGARIPGKREEPYMPKCYPGANCWMGDKMVWPIAADGDKHAGPDVIEGLAECFPHSHNRRLEAGEIGSGVLRAEEEDAVFGDEDGRVVSGEVARENPAEEEGGQSSVVAVGGGVSAKDDFWTRRLDDTGDPVDRLGVGDGRILSESREKFHGLRGAERRLSEKLARFEHVLGGLEKRKREIAAEKEGLYRMAVEQRRENENLRREKQKASAPPPPKEDRPKVVYFSAASSPDPQTAELHFPEILRQRFGFGPHKTGFYSGGQFNTGRELPDLLGASDQARLTTLNRDLLPLLLLRTMLFDFFEAFSHGPVGTSLLTRAEQKTIAADAVDIQHCVHELKARASFDPFESVGRVVQASPGAAELLEGGGGGSRT